MANRQPRSTDQHCPRCGTELDDDQWCENCDEVISDQEITDHEAMWGDLWEPYGA